MDSEIPYSKFKILFINTFSILYKAATLNPYRLQSEIQEVKNVLQNSSDEILLPNILIILISLLLIAKFFFGYVSLAASIIAIFPIITHDKPELLLPIIVAQATENILLNAVEILLGYVTCRYYIPGKMSVFSIFLARMVFRMLLSVSTLNMYSDLYSQLKYPPVIQTSDLKMDSFLETSEQLIQQQTLL